MGIHYTRSKINRELTLLGIANTPEQKAWELFKECRFGKEDNFACPDCTAVDKHWFIKTRKQWTCKHCYHRFSVTSGTALHSRKLSFTKLLTTVFSFVTAAQGANANTLPSDLGVTYKTGFLNFSKIREVIFQTMDLTPLKGLVHIDCMHICGKPRRSNKRKATDSVLVNNKLRSRKDSIVPDKRTHPEPHNIEKLKKRRIVLALSQIAQRDGQEPYGSDRTIIFVIPSESAKVIIPLIKKSVDKDAMIMTDFGGAFNNIEAFLGNTHFAVNHSKEYVTDLGVNNNQAESFFSRIRRAEYGTFNGISYQYLPFYAAEFAYRNDSKHTSIRDRFNALLAKLLKSEPSKAFCGYQQGNRLGFEYCHE